MQFRPIDLTHPFLGGPESTGEHEAWRPSTYDKLFQPVDAVWPIYWVKVNRIAKNFLMAEPGTGIGFTTDISVKNSEDGFWTSCNRWEPIPFEFIPVLTEMLDGVFTEEFGERP